MSRQCYWKCRNGWYFSSVIVANTSLSSQEANVISKAYHHKQNLHNCVKQQRNKKRRRKKNSLLYSPREDLQNGRERHSVIVSVSNNILSSIQIQREVILKNLSIIAFNLNIKQILLKKPVVSCMTWKCDYHNSLLNFNPLNKHFMFFT